MKHIGRYTILFLASTALMVQAGAIRNLPGFTTTVYGPNDDGSYPCTGMNDGAPAGDCAATAVPIGFTINFYGVSFDSLYVNNNGNVTFLNPLSDFTPFGLVGTDSQIIAPYFSDVDTRVGNLVTFGTDTVDGHAAFGVDWIGVGYYSTNTDKLNSFQLILIDRSDRNPGDFDIEFNYDQVQWETGDASGGIDGLGGDSAVAGFSNGSGQPGTSFQLHGSAIPGELLDSNPGGLIHGFLNNTNAGRYLIPIVNLTDTNLNVTGFVQGDARWAIDQYGNSTHTIQEKGSALCCLAMALNYSGMALTPATLNQLMSSDHDFIGTSVNWDAATRDASGHTLVFASYRSSDTQYLNQMLAAGHPVIVGVNLDGDGVPSHFVLVTGKKNGHLVIIDPGQVAATNLDYYYNAFETRGVIGVTAGNVSGLDISVGNAADLLVVDPLGRRTGYDPASSQTLEEIPQSVHFLDLMEDSDLTGARGQDTAHSVSIFQPVAGTYQLFLSGTNAGAFQLAFRPFATSGSSGTPATLTGTNSPTGLAEFQVKLSSGGITSQTFTNECPWSLSPTNGALPLTVELAAPSVDSAGNTVTNWSWNLGDGGTGGGQNYSYNYTTGGIHFASLSAIDTTGNTVISYGPAAVIPTVNITASPTDGANPLTVQFSAGTMDSLGSAISGWNWDFRDGATSTDPNPTHIYTATGMFTPVLVAVDGLGLTIVGDGPAIFPGTESGLVTNGDFESGDFTGWSLSGDSDLTFVDTGSNIQIAPESGTYAAFFETYGATSYLSQNIPTVAGGKYRLSFWLNSTDGQTPHDFNVSWDGTILTDLTDLPAPGWTNIQLVAEAATNGTALVFAAQDYPSYLALDNISVVSLQPVLNGISFSGSDLILNGSGVGGTTNYLLMGTNLTAPFNQWRPVATNILTADGGFSLTATNAANPAVPGRYYILQLQ